MSYETKIETLRGGAALEMVNNALAEVWENILDPNTESTTKRSVVMKLEFKPSADRSSSPVSIKVEKKLAPQAAVSAHVNIGTDHDGIATASEYMNPNQNELPVATEQQDDGAIQQDSASLAPNVTPFKTAANAN